MTRRHKTGIVTAVAMVGLIVCAFIFPLRSPALSGVHPQFANLKEPIRVTATRYYLDGGSIGLEIVDGSSATNRFAFPVSYEGDRRRYPHFIVGVWHSRTNTHERIPLDEQTRAYVCYLVESKALQNVDDDLVLVHLRGAPRDYLPLVISGIRKLSPFKE